MRLKEVEVHIENIVDGEQDYFVVEALKNMIRDSPSQKVGDFFDALSKKSLAHHITGKEFDHFWIKNIADTSVKVAIIIRRPECLEEKKRRWTHWERRIVKRCYPYLSKWNHMARVLKRTWCEIEGMAEQMSLTVRVSS